MEEIDNIIGVKLCRYFQQFSQTFEYCTGEKPTPDWHEFLEYGFRSPMPIWLCKQGFTREAAKLIFAEATRYIEEIEDHWKLKWTELLETENELIRTEASRVILLQGNPGI